MTRGLLAVLLAAFVVGAAAGVGAVRLAIATGLPARVAQAAPAATAASAEDAVRATVARANDEQRRAIAGNDPTVMRDTATAEHYAEMVKIDRDLTNAGVTSIDLVDLSFTSVTVDGASATATTEETWRSTYADGTRDEQTARNEYALVLEDGSWKIASDTQPDVQQGIAPGAPAGATPAANVSRNWSGYVATGGPFTSVTGTWTVPQPNPSVAGVDATWVGIGGQSSRDLIQAGTEAEVGRGGVSYDAWIELLPDAQRTVPLTVTGGDTVTVTLAEQGSGQWRVSLKNVTTGRSYETTVRYASSHSSAEWVEEAPSAGRQVVPLDQFGTVRFSDGAATAGGRSVTIAGAGAKPITMADASGRSLAVPSALGADGKSFSVSRAAAGTSPRTRRG